MNPYMAYEAANVKILTKKSRLLDEKKFEKIMQLNSIDQVTEYLKNNYDLNLIENHDLHRDELETLLNRYEVVDIESILHYFSGPYKEFLQVTLMEFEISDLVMILRKIAKGEDLNGIEKGFIHSGVYSSLQYGKLTSSKNVMQFIENLKGTPYYNSLKTVTDSDVVKRAFHIEMKLQLLLYRTLFQKADRLYEADRRVANEIIGTKTDFLNVQWIYRAKKYYDISPDQILIYSLQKGEKLSFERLRKLSYSKSVEEIQQLSNNFLKYEIFSKNNDLDFERNIDNYIYSYIKKINSKGTIGTALSYIYMLDIAVRELITITEGIRYKLPKEQLRQYLIRSR